MTKFQKSRHPKGEMEMTTEINLTTGTLRDWLAVREFSLNTAQSQFLAECMDSLGYWAEHPTEDWSLFLSCDDGPDFAVENDAAGTRVISDSEGAWAATSWPGHVEVRDVRGTSGGMDTSELCTFCREADCKQIVLQIADE